MKFDGERVMSLLAAWATQIKGTPVFVCNGHAAYVYDKSTGVTLQFVTPEGMTN